MQKTEWQGAAIARRVRLLILVLIVMLFIVGGAGLMAPKTEHVQIVQRFGSCSSGSLVSTGGLVLVIAGLIQLERVLRTLGLGNPFNTRAVRGMRRFALLSSIGTSATVLSSTLCGLLNARDGGEIIFLLKMPDLVLLSICIVFFVVTALMAEAARIADENEQII
jgi:hypothetical protein